MEVLKEHKRYQLIERYGKPYLHFWGGREDDIPCEFPVSEEDAENVLQDTSVMEELLAKAKTKINWTAESFYHIGIMEFLHYQVELFEKRAEHFL